MEPVPNPIAFEHLDDVQDFSPEQKETRWRELGTYQPSIQQYIERVCDDLRPLEAHVLQLVVLGCWQAMLDFYEDLPSVNKPQIEEAEERHRRWREVEERMGEKAGIPEDLEEERKSFYYSYSQQELMQSASVLITNATNLEEARFEKVPLQMMAVRTVIDVLNPSDDIEPYFDQDQEMTDRHLLAAEYYSYSYDNYRDHLGIGHARYERLMPENAETLREAIREGWSDERIARQLEIDPDDVPEQKEMMKRALEVVKAPNPAESFRQGVRQSIEHAMEEGLEDEEDVRDLVVQICYRAADLGFLLDREETSLSEYSRNLRSDPDTEYHNRENPYDDWQTREDGEKANETNHDGGNPK